MLSEALAPCDGANLARLVRAVGFSARRNLNRPPNPSEAGELLRAIDSIESEVGRLPSGDLSRWLRSLRRRIEDHLDPIP